MKHDKITGFVRLLVAFILPLVIIGCAVLGAVQMREFIVEEKLVEHRYHMQDELARLDLWIRDLGDDLEYEDLLAKTVSELDAEPNVFAALYKRGDRLLLLSTRSVDTSVPFNPLIYDELTFTDTSGVAVINWVEEGEQMRVYWRWLDGDDTYLLIMAADERHLQIRIDSAIDGYILMLIVVTSLVCLVQMMVFSTYFFTNTSKRTYDDSLSTHVQSDAE